MMYKLFFYREGARRKSTKAREGVDYQIYSFVPFVKILCVLSG